MIFQQSFLFFLCCSSPHLVEVRERIRINGNPLEKELFAKYFFECYERLVNTLVGITFMSILDN